MTSGNTRDPLPDALPRTVALGPVPRLTGATPDELMVTTPVHDHIDRYRSFQLIAPSARGCRCVSGQPIQQPTH
jgi:hypothetical protein